MAKHHPDLIFCRKQAGVGEAASRAAAPWVGAVLGVGESGFHLSPRSCLGGATFPAFGGRAGFWPPMESRRGSAWGAGGGWPGWGPETLLVQGLAGASGRCGFGKWEAEVDEIALCIPASVPTPNSRMFFYSASES